MLTQVAEGKISDVTGIALYVAIGFYRGMDGELTLVKRYRCLRGTNGLEGGVHSNLKEKWSPSGVAIRSAQARITSYAFVHNEIVRLSIFLS